MIEETLSNAESGMKKSIQALERDLASIRTGRANASLVEGLMIDYYGTQTHLNQLATIAAPDARTLTIQAWDKQAMGGIEKAILKSDLGLTPVNDGTLIRLPIPLLTEERRKDLARVVRKRVEEGKVSLRNVRRDGNDRLRAAEKRKELSQDEQHRAEERLQKATDSFVGQVDELGARKEAELMEV